MVLRAKKCQGVYCSLCKIGARKSTLCLLISFAAQSPDVHDSVRILDRAHKILEKLPRNVTCREITGAIQPVHLIANFTKSFDN